MNIDDFIVPSSIASPAGTAAEAPNGSLNNQSSSRVGMPIAENKAQQQGPMQLPAASMPKQIRNKGRTGEFDYVQRRVRKTSIDEKSVRNSCTTHVLVRLLMPLPEPQATS